MTTRVIVVRAGSDGSAGKPANWPPWQSV